MTKRGAPPGNKNAATGADNNPFKSALNRAIAQDNSKKIMKAAQQLLDQAANGEPWAIKELADRTDGKAVQAVEAKVDASVTVEIVRFGSHPPA